MDLGEDLAKTLDRVVKLLKFFPAGHGHTLRVTNTLHHGCTTRDGQTRSLAVTGGHPEMTSDLRIYKTVLVCAYLATCLRG